MKRIEPRAVLAALPSMKDRAEDLFVVGPFSLLRPKPPALFLKDFVKQRSSFDMPMIFTNQRRAILVLER